MAMKPTTTMHTCHPLCFSVLQSIVFISSYLAGKFSNIHSHVSLTIHFVSKTCPISDLHQAKLHNLKMSVFILIAVGISTGIYWYLKPSDSVKTVDTVDHPNGYSTTMTYKSGRSLIFTERRYFNFIPAEDISQRIGTNTFVTECATIDIPA